MYSFIFFNLSFYLSIIYLFVYSFIYIISTPLFIHLFIHFLYSGISIFFFIYWEQFFLIFFFGRGGYDFNHTFQFYSKYTLSRKKIFFFCCENRNIFPHQLSTKRNRGFESNCLTWLWEDGVSFIHSFFIIFLIEIHNIYHWYKHIQLYKCQ